MMIKKDIKSHKLMYLKAILFLLILVISVIEILLTTRDLKTGILLILIIWASARIYYFMFYVIENYIDTNYKFSGIISFVQYLIRNKN